MYYKIYIFVPEPKIYQLLLTISLKRFLIYSDIIVQI